MANVNSGSQQIVTVDEENMNSAGGLPLSPGSEAEIDVQEHQALSTPEINALEAEFEKDQEQVNAGTPVVS